MADILHLILAQASETVQENATNFNATNTTTGAGKGPSTPEGTAVAYASLIVMAMLPIYFGSLRSVNYNKNNKHHSQNEDNHSFPKAERMGMKDAAIFPILASGALFSLYIVFKLFSKEYINLLLTGYFFFLGILALTHLLNPVFCKLVPSAVPNIPFHLLFRQGDGDTIQDIINYRFTTYDMVSLGCSSLVGIWYLWKKHWIANNLFGIAFAVNAVELLHLTNVATGCTLLGGLFIYDIFWVFGTDVMVSVAMNFEAPIKLLFPRDLLISGVSASNFAILGLGDIVIPGIFIALLLRFDRSLQRRYDTYFYATCIAYFLGLLTTIFVMHMFKHAQPALLYLVPACLGTPIALALVTGDLSRLFKYEDAPEENEGEGGEDAAKSDKKQEAKKAK